MTARPGRVAREVIGRPAASAIDGGEQPPRRGDRGDRAGDAGSGPSGGACAVGDRVRRIGAGIISLAAFLVGLEAGHRHRQPGRVHPAAARGGRGAWRPGHRIRHAGDAHRRDARRDPPGLRRRRADGHRHRHGARQERAHRARAVAVHRRGASGAHPGPGAVARHLVRRRAAGAGADLRADRLLPDRHRHHGRHPLGRSAAGRDAPLAGRHAAAAHRPARDPIGAAGHLRRPAGGGHAGRHRRRRRRMGRCQLRPGRAHQHRQPGAVRHPAHVRRARHAGRHRHRPSRPGGRSPSAGWSPT